MRLHSQLSALDAAAISTVITIISGFVFLFYDAA